MQQLNQKETELLKVFEDTLVQRGSRFYTKLTENELIEFKKSLNANENKCSKDYLDTIAGFANNMGGFFIFGIDPDSFEILGISEKFENLDQKSFSTTINDGIDGNIKFNYFTHRY